LMNYDQASLNYTMNDVAFAGRWQAAKEMALITFMDLAAKVERLHLVEAFGHIIGAFAEMVELEAQEADQDTRTRAHSLAREMPQRTEQLEREIARGRLSVWAAFKGFCAEEMGLEAETLLEALADPLVETARELEEIAERLEVQPDLEIAKECAATFRGSWQRQLANGA
jgi:hypothetical protein